MLTKNLVGGAIAAAVLLAGAQTALADPALPNLENLNFLQYTGSAPKNYFNNVNPVGWTGGSNLIFIDTPGNGSNPNSACGSIYLQTYGCPSTLAIPGGYNYVEADGNPAYETGFNYSVSGLTSGTTYSLSFYQAASQQTGFTGNTTEQWVVSLGTSGLTETSLGGGFDGYTNADSSASVVSTPLMSTPSGGMTDWNYVTVNLTADSSTDLLSFLAWGDNGNTVNLPPIVFLTGVNSPSGLNETPEPGTLAIFGAGLLGLGVFMARGRKRRSSAS